MAAVVVDCAFILAWALDEEKGDALVDVLELVSRHGGEVPRIWPVELANALLKLVRRKLLGRERVRQVLADIGEYPIKVDGEIHRLAWTRILLLAEQHGLSTYDACYLELSVRRGLALATKDVPLARAAEKMGVLVLPRRHAQAKSSHD